MICFSFWLNERVILAASFRCLKAQVGGALLATLFLAALNQSWAQTPAQRAQAAIKIAAGFDQFVAPDLKKPLWEQATAYNTGHVMMAPMIAAFRLDRKDWLDAFEGQFARFVESDTATFQAIEIKQTLTRLHYVFLASTYVALAYEHKQMSRIPAGLAEKVHLELNGYYQLKATWWYAPRSYAGGMKERVEARMENRARRASQAKVGAFIDRNPQYYDGFADDAAFVLAGLANLAAWERTNKRAPAVATPAAQLMLRVLREYGDFRPTGYVFQAGQWADHPDYAHAGYLEVAKNLPPKYKADLAEDSSHSSRWPIFIQATRRGLVAPSDRSELARIESELARQFYSHVLVAPSAEFPCFRLTNYADGYNGLYRYAYEGRGDGFAYEAYMTSSVLFIGWWVFLPPPKDKLGIWRALHDCFPMPSPVIELYLGPMLDPTQRKSKATAPNEFNNGRAEFRALLHAAMAVPN